MGATCSRPSTTGLTGHRSRAPSVFLPEPAVTLDSVAPETVTLEIDTFAHRLEALALPSQRASSWLLNAHPEGSKENEAATVVQAVYRGWRSRRSHIRSQTLAKRWDLPPLPSFRSFGSDANEAMPAAISVRRSFGTDLSNSPARKPLLSPKSNALLATITTDVTLSLSKLPVHRSRVGSTPPQGKPPHVNCHASIQWLTDGHRPTLSQLRAMSVLPESQPPGWASEDSAGRVDASSTLRSARAVEELLVTNSVLYAGVEFEFMRHDPCKLDPPYRHLSLRPSSVLHARHSPVPTQPHPTAPRPAPPRSHPSPHPNPHTHSSPHPNPHAHPSPYPHSPFTPHPNPHSHPSPHPNPNSHPSPHSHSWGSQGYSTKS